MLGKTLPGSAYPYSFALDFDGEYAVMEFFGSWDKVLSLSRRTRIEWHQDRGRLQIVFFSKRRVTKKRIKTKQAGAAFEVRCDELLIASPSIHCGGNAWTVLGVDQISALPDEELLRLETKIDSLSGGEGYMSGAPTISVYKTYVGFSGSIQYTSPDGSTNLASTSFTPDIKKISKGNMFEKIPYVYTLKSTFSGPDGKLVLNNPALIATNGTIHLEGIEDPKTTD